MAMGGKTLTVYLAADLKKFNSGLSQAQRGIGGFGSSLTSVLGPALLAAGAAAGAFAIKLGIDGVKAAIEDEASLAKLAKTLENVGLAHDTERVEDYISSLERSLGVADEQLRPAYDRLVRSIGDTGKANDALALSLDIAAGTGKSLDAVVQALGKAYDGNTAGLGRLGVGIDAAVLRTGDMNQITRHLAATFDGQARTSASTYEGQLQRLSTAADNMKEAFGRGLLNALGDTDKTTQNFVDTMEDLEPLLEGIGGAVGKFATTTLNSYNQSIKRTTDNTDAAADSMKGLETTAGASGFVLGEIFGSLTGPGSPLGVFLGLLGQTPAAVEEAAEAAEDTIPSWRDYSHSIRMTNDAFIKYLQLNSVRMNIVKEENKGYKDLAARQREVNTYTSIAVDLTDDLTTSRGGASKAADRQAIAENRLTEAFQNQQSVISGVSSQLQQATRDLESARKAAEDYAAGIAAQITSGINLGTAFEGQFDEAGQRTGASLLDGFNKQIEQAQYFGNVLTAIKAQGADQSLIEHIASLGPVTGAALGQQMLDEGLVKTLSDKWVEVQDQTKTLAMGLVPEFMTAGIASGEAMVTSLAEQVKNETKILTRLGRQIAKPVGAGFKAQFLKDIADAVAEVEAIQSAARAEKVAAATARGQILTEQAVAQALGQIINRSDARLGVTNQPVLA